MNAKELGKQAVGENETEITEFILIGLSGRPKTRMILISVMALIYLLAMVGNCIILLVVITDPRLHTPMYFFLCNLSIIDIGYSTASGPHTIANCMVDRPVVPYALCFSQFYALLYLGSTECFLLAVMAYDQYVAISKPLHYTIVMNWKVCVLLALGAWAAAFFFSMVPCIAQTFNFCGHNEVDHFACELTGLFNLFCSGTEVNQMSMYFTSSFTILMPLLFIFFSYMHILVAILRIHSTSARKKAFSTCGSLLTVVAIYYGNCIVSYIMPQSNDNESDNIIFVLNAAVVPMLNPLIYTLRNQEVKKSPKAVKREETLNMYV